MNRDQRSDERWEKVRDLWHIIDRLRGPGGCPWDRKQTPETIQTYLVEEAHEAAAAVRARLGKEVADELGDILFMVLFLAYLYEERGEFRLEDVCGLICEKMIRRHPHVFGELTVQTAEEVVDNWEKIKAGEKAATGKGSLGIPESLPALMRGYRMLSRLAGGQQPGWNDVKGQLEEFSAMNWALQQDLSDGVEVPGEAFGKLLLSTVNLARLRGYQAENCLHEALRHLETANE